MNKCLTLSALILSFAAAFADEPATPDANDARALFNLGVNGHRLSPKKPANFIIIIRSELRANPPRRARKCTDSHELIDYVASQAQMPLTGAK